MIKKTTIDLSEERRVLTHMIVSTPFLTELRGIVQPKLFESSYSRIVSGWILDYFNYTNQAPEKAIEDIYIKKRSEIRDENDQDLIQEFLKSLSQDWVKNSVHNVSYSVKNAIEFFKIRSLDRLKNKLEEAIKMNDSPGAERLLSEYKSVDRPISRGVNLLENTSAVIQAFSQEQELLFTFPGELGEKIGPFMRGDFVSILGAMKRGKTHYLWLSAYRALLAGLRVVFMSLEMTQEQMLRRMWQGMVGRPLKDGNVKTPFFKENLDGTYDIEFENKNLKGIDLTKIKDKQDFYKKHIRSGELKLITYPSGKVTVKDIETELINLEYFEDFVPDVIVIDYADLMESGDNRLEYRHRLDNIWKNLRGIAQQRNLCVITASQTGRKGLNNDVDGEDVAEDVRKLAHVTKMISLNQSALEKDDGVMRISTALQREGKTFMGQIVVLQSLDIGRPYMDSKIKDKVNMRKYEVKKKKEPSDE